MCRLWQVKPLRQGLTLKVSTAVSFVLLAQLAGLAFSRAEERNIVVHRGQSKS